MTYRPDSEMYIPESAAEDLDTRRRIGWLYGCDSEHPLEIVDPLDDKGDGAIEVRRHPDMLRLEHPELWGILDKFQAGCFMSAGPAGVMHTISSRHYEELSNFEFILLRTMIAAHSREQSREIERLKDKQA